MDKIECDNRCFGHGIQSNNFYVRTCTDCRLKLKYDCMTGFRQVPGKLTIRLFLTRQVEKGVYDPFSTLVLFGMVLPQEVELFCFHSVPAFVEFVAQDETTVVASKAPSCQLRKV